MAIMMNDIMNNESRVSGFAAYNAFRNAVVNKLYEKSIVIRKFEVTVNNKTNEIKVDMK